MAGGRRAGQSARLADPGRLATAHRHSDEARRRREETAAQLAPRDAHTAPPPGEGRAPSEDDTLTLLFLCCHPLLTPAAQIALTLRAVGGLTTAEIARALLVPEATTAQRISRAKAKIKGVPFRPPGPEDRDERLSAVLQVLYLIFNEGYTATSGATLHRADLAREAIRLTRAVRRLLPREGRVTGLLALMLLTDARSAARTGPHGELIPLDEQDRARWDRDEIAEGTALVEEALSEGPAGPYQLQAAIAALHDEAARAEDTDWPQILALYDVLVRRAPEPMPSWAGPWRSRWWRDRRRDWRNSARWRTGWRAITDWTRYGRICWSGPGTRTPPATPTGEPPHARSALPSRATSGCARPGCARRAAGGATAEGACGVWSVEPRVGSSRWESPGVSAAPTSRKSCRTSGISCDPPVPYRR